MNDLTLGKPFYVIWRFSLPLLLSMALQQFYNLADSMIVGQLFGSRRMEDLKTAISTAVIALHALDIVRKRQRNFPVQPRKTVV